jgi:hypothetical protein
MMTPEQLQHLRDALTAARQPVNRADKYAFPRGWNDALDFVEKLIKEVLDEPAYRNLDGPVSADEFGRTIT